MQINFSITELSETFSSVSGYRGLLEAINRKYNQDVLFSKEMAGVVAQGNEDKLSEAENAEDTVREIRNGLAQRIAEFYPVNKVYPVAADFENDIKTLRLMRQRIMEQRGVKKILKWWTLRKDISQYKRKGYNTAEVLVLAWQYYKQEYPENSIRDFRIEAKKICNV